MSIVSLNKLEVNGFKAKVSNKLKFYKGDKLNLSFSISNTLISEINSKEVINGILPIDSDNIKAFMLIKDKEIAGTIIENNNIIFKFSPEHQEIGINQFQIVITELQEDGSKEILHTPPFVIEIAEPIGTFEEPEENIAKVDYAIVGKSVVGSDKTTYININSRYQMTVWETGDIITAAKLNNIENALLEHAKMLDELLYKAITITSFNISKSIAELGEIVANLKLTWSYSKDPVLQKLDNNILENNIREYIIDSDIVTNRTFRLEVNDGKTTVNKTVAINFYNGRYYGVSSPGSYDSDFILTLNKTLTNSRACSFTVDCGQGQYIFFAIPTRFGTPTFTVGGFTGGFIKAQTLDFENKFGYVESYDIWKSENSNLGNITVVVG